MRRLRNDDGASAIVVAIVLPVVLLGMAALTLDIGSMYVQKRQLQNGADAAALAVARDCAASPDTCDATIAAALGAEDLATPNSDVGAGNFGEASTVLLCGTIPGLAPCLGADAPEAAWVGDAPYVKARTRGSNAPILGQFVGYGGGTIVAEAVATLDEKRRIGGGTSPFAVCGYNTDDVRGWPGVDLLTGSFPDYAFNPLAKDQLYPVWSQKDDVINQCGQGEAWAGWMDDEETYTLPGFVDLVTGGKVGHLMFLEDYIASCEIKNGDIKSGEDSCYVALPVCTSDEASHKIAYCVGWGGFRLTNDRPAGYVDEPGEKSIFGYYTGEEEVAGPDAAPGEPTEGEAYVVAPRLAG